MSTQKIAIVGGGIIGLALAYKLQHKFPAAQVVLFEKESSVGKHQSGRNSGVLHCGLHYQPGSLKAQLAVNGIRQMIDFCRKEQINHDVCGKIVVASEKNQVKFLDELAKRGHKNGLKNLQFLSAEALKKREPHVASKKTLLVPEEGIVDYKMVMERLRNIIESKGGEIVLSTKINTADEVADKVILKSKDKEWSFDLLLSCGGLYSDRNYQHFTSKKSPLKIIPFRGEYLMLKPSVKHLVNHLVYPVPDPQFPFLGVHFTRLTNGQREVGPNAVFAFKREGYKKRDISFTDLYDSLFYKGFLKFTAKNFRFCLNEFTGSLFMSAFVKKARKLIPEVHSSMFVKGTAGVRAQAMNPEGALVMDFNIIKENKQIHLLNAPSPGATASFAIADYILDNYL